MIAHETTDRISQQREHGLVDRSGCADEVEHRSYSQAAGAAPSCTWSARTRVPSVFNEASEAPEVRRWDSADRAA